MHSINDHLNTLRKELLNKQVSVDFIEEFLDSYIDQLESMKEEIQNEKTVNLDEIDELVLKRCEPIDQVIKHVVEQYENQEISTNRYTVDLSSSESLLVFVGIFRMLIIFFLAFTMYLVVFPAWDYDWGMIDFNRIFVSSAAQIDAFNILLIIFSGLMISDVLLTRKINLHEITNTKFHFLLNSSLFKVFYRSVLLLCLVPVLVPLYIFSDTPNWIIRIYSFITIIMTLSAIGWFQEVDRGIKERQIIADFNPVTLLIGYNLTVFIINPIISLIKQLFTTIVLNDQREISNNIENIFLMSIFSLLFLLATNVYWRNEFNKKRLSIRTLSRWVLLWILLICILGITLLLEETLMSDIFNTWQYYDEFYQAIYFLLFLFLVILVIGYIPQINAKFNRIWLLFGFTGYSTVAISNLLFRKSLNDFVEENLFMNYETYLSFLKYHEFILIVLAFITTIAFVLIILRQKEKLGENPKQMEFYTWTFRLYLFFLLYELGTVNLLFYSLTQLSFKLEWLGQGLVLLAFVGLIIISETFGYFVTGYETKLVQTGKQLRSTFK